MNNEFKKIIKNKETRYVLEDASAGATAASSIAAVESPLGILQSRLQELKTKVSVPVSKPRNPAGMGANPGRGTQTHKDKKYDQKIGKEKHKKPFYEKMMEEIESLAELDKPSGSMFLKFRGKRLPGDEMMLLGYGGFGNTPKDITAGNALVKPFPADDAYDVINKIESLFKDKDFIGVEKIILDIPGSLSGQLRDVLDYAEQDPERFELYTGDDTEEPEAKTGGKVIGIGPDGKRIDRTPPKAQVGGSSRGIASTGMVTVQADSTGQRLISGLVSQGKLSRDTKVQGNKITLRKDDYSKMMSVLGNAKFQQMFTKVGSVAEGDDQPDHEISMASSELQSIAADAAKLLDMVRQRSEEEGLEAWQQSKITKAADFMNSVLQSIRGDEEQGVAEGDPLAARQQYAQQHKNPGQVYKPTYPGDKKGMTKAYAYDIKRTGPKGQLPKEDINDGAEDFRDFANFYNDPNPNNRPPEAEEAVGLITAQGQNPMVTAQNIVNYAQANPNAVEDVMNPEQLADAIQQLKLYVGQDVSEAHGNSKIYDKCWTGFRKVPGKKRGEEDSCTKIKKEDAYINRLMAQLESKK